jgi:TM2 domain-containing membrane protein YozV
MRKKIKNILVLGTFLTLLCNVSFASMYKMDHDAVDVLFAEAVEISSSLDAASLFNATGTNAVLSNSPNPWVAFAICWVVGGFGVHRHYLGTSGSMWALYTFTCGGIFGIVTFVDWVVLLIGAANDDISKYVNNTSFFMW